MHNKVWDEITYPFPNFNGEAVEVWEWRSNVMPHFIRDVIAYIYIYMLELKLTHVGKRGPICKMVRVFVGDMGGYLGLLIGASAITVFELVDLIVYNCFRKMLLREKPKPKQEEEKGMALEINNYL